MKASSINSKNSFGGKKRLWSCYKSQTWSKDSVCGTVLSAN